MGEATALQQIFFWWVKPQPSSWSFLISEATTLQLILFLISEATVLQLILFLISEATALKLSCSWLVKTQRSSWSCSWLVKPQHQMHPFLPAANFAWIRKISGKNSWDHLTATILSRSVPHSDLNTASGLLLKGTVVWDFLASVFFTNQHLIGPWWTLRNSFIYFANSRKYSCMKFDFPRIICGKSNYCSQLHHVFEFFSFKSRVVLVTHGWLLV